MVSIEQLIDDAKCYEVVRDLRWPNGVHCPNCNTDNLARSIGAGAGLIFKGSGFYLTDYKKSGSSPGSTPEKKPDSGKTEKT